MVTVATLMLSFAGFNRDSESSSKNQKVLGQHDVLINQAMITGQGWDLYEGFHLPQAVNCLS